MDIQYKNKTLQKECTNFKKAVQKYNRDVAEKLINTVDFIEAAENISSVVQYQPFHFHQLKGDRKGYFGIYLGRKLGFRLIVRPKINNHYATNEEVYGNEADNIVIISFEEVTNHYE